MSHFRAWIKGNHGESSRLGTRASGVHLTAQSHAGDLTVTLYVDENGDDSYEIMSGAHYDGNALARQHIIASGKLGIAPDGRAMTPGNFRARTPGR